MDCDVCIGTDVDETYAESSTISDKRARRAHKCCECGGVIAKGDVHEHAAGRDKYWGDADSQNNWDHYRTCQLCAEIRGVFTCGQGWYYGTLWADMREYAFERLTTSSPCFIELSAPAKEFVLTRWRKWKGLPR